MDLVRRPLALAPLLVGAGLLALVRPASACGLCHKRTHHASAVTYSAAAGLPAQALNFAVAPTFSAPQMAFVAPASLQAPSYALQAVAPQQAMGYVAPANYAWVPVGAGPNAAAGMQGYGQAGYGAAGMQGYGQAGFNDALTAIRLIRQLLGRLGDPGSPDGDGGPGDDGGLGGSGRSFRIDVYVHQGDGSGDAPGDEKLPFGVDPRGQRGGAQGSARPHAAAQSADASSQSAGALGAERVDERLSAMERQMRNLTEAVEQLGQRGEASQKPPNPDPNPGK